MLSQLKNLTALFYSPQHRLFVNYALIGVYGLLISGLVFSVTYEVVGVSANTANMLGAVAGMLNNFACNAILNFQKTDFVFVRLARYVIVGSLGIVLTSITFSILNGTFGINAYIAWITATIITVTGQFIINSRWAFGEVNYWFNFKEVLSDS